MFMLDGKIGLWANVGLVNIPVSAQHHKIWTLQPPGEGTGTRKLAPTLATQHGDLEIGDLTAVVFTPDSEPTVTQQSDSLHFFSRAA